MAKFVGWFSKRSRSARDRVILIVSAIIVFFVSASVHATDAIIAWLYRHNTWRLNELVTVSIFLVLASVVYVWRRHREYVEEVERRKEAEAEREELIAQLQRDVDDFPAQVTLLPICVSCKRVRDRRGSWRSIEVYLASRFHIKPDPGLCPDCAKVELSRANMIITPSGSGHILKPLLHPPSRP